MTILPVLGLALSYLIGSTPNAWIAGKLIKGVDLRTIGSGNLGTTNVYRALGAPAAVSVFLLDVAKGLVPALWFATLFRVGHSPWWPIAYGVAAILGHVRPYLGFFKGGGKGVATSAGVFTALAPVALVAGLTAFALTVLVSRYVSLGSILGAITLAVAAAVVYGIRSPLGMISAAVALLVIWNHRANISRLRRGEESRIGKRASAA